MEDPSEVLGNSWEITDLEGRLGYQTDMSTSSTEATDMVGAPMDRASIGTDPEK